MHFSRGIIKLKYLYRGQKKVRATCRTEHETNKKKKLHEKFIFDELIFTISDVEY